MPLCFIKAVKNLAREPIGNGTVLPLLRCLMGLFLWIPLATAFRNGAEIEFTMHEMIGPVGGFAVPGLGGA